MGSGGGGGTGQMVTDQSESVHARFKAGTRTPAASPSSSQRKTFLLQLRPLKPPQDQITGQPAPVSLFTATFIEFGK